MKKILIFGLILSLSSCGGSYKKLSKQQSLEISALKKENNDLRYKLIEVTDEFEVYKNELRFKRGEVWGLKIKIDSLNKELKKLK